MLYYYVKTVVLDGKEKRFPAFLCDDEREILTDFLSDSSLFAKLRTIIPDVRLAWFEGDSLPTILLQGMVLDQTQIKNVSDIFEFSKKILAKYGKLSKDIQELMIPKVAQRYDAPLARVLIAASAVLLTITSENFSMPINVGVDMISDEVRTITMQKIAAYNAGFKRVFKSISDLENVTVRQTKEDDPVFIEIPDRSVLLSEDRRWGNIIPPRAQVYTAYSEKAAYAKDYKDRVSKHLIPLIEGQKENNSLPIQDNEKKYYDALCEWVAFNVQEEFGESGDDVIDNVSREYLLELCNHVYAWGWAHNPNIPIDFVDDVDLDELSEDDDSSTMDGAMSRYVFERDVDDDRPIQNALIDLQHFIENASSVIGWKAYVEAVVKLLRWGLRKPTVLKLDGYSKVFELATNFERQDLGSVDDYQLKVVNGNSYSFIGWITPSLNAMDSTLKGKNYTNVPVGIAVKSVMVSPNGDELDVPTYYPLFDVVPMIKSGELRIDGITQDLKVMVKPKVFPTELLLGDYRSHPDEFVKNPLWRSKELKELCLEFNAGRSGDELNLLCIFDEVMKNSNFTKEAEQFAVSSVEELKKKLASYVIYSGSAALVTNVGQLLLPIVDEVIESDKEILEAWDDALQKWNGVKSFLTGNELKSMDVFENSEFRIKALNPKKAVAQIVGTDGSVLGGYSVERVNLGNREVKHYVLIGKEEYEGLASERKASNKVPIGKLTGCYHRDLEKIKQGAKEACQMYFSSAETLKYFDDLLK